jgi:hypothetical protein
LVVEAAAATAGRQPGQTNALSRHLEVATVMPQTSTLVTAARPAGRAAVARRSTQRSARRRRRPAAPVSRTAVRRFKARCKGGKGASRQPPALLPHLSPYHYLPIPSSFQSPFTPFLRVPFFKRPSSAPLCQRCSLPASAHRVNSPSACRGRPVRGKQTLRRGRGRALAGCAVGGMHGTQAGPAGLQEG